MKKIIVSVCLSVYLMSLPCVGFAAVSDDYDADSEVGFLVEMLVENGTVTREQAQKLAQKAKLAKKARQKETEEIVVAYMEREQDGPELEDLSQKVMQLETEMENARRQGVVGNRRLITDQLREQEMPMDVSWDDGLHFETRDGDFETKIGGRIIADAVNTFSHGDLPESIRPLGDFNNRNDQAYLRSARLSIEGTMYEDYFYNFEYEFDGDINSKTEVDGLRDMYFGLKDIPYIGKMSVGHMKEPFSLEESSSRTDLTFLERSLANVFAPGFSWGVNMQNSILDDRLTYNVGLFYDSDSSGTTSHGNAVNLTGRVTGLPWYGGKDKLLHLGASYSLRNPKEGGFEDNEVRFRQRPDIYTRDYIVDTGDIDIDKENRLGLEAAYMYGPFSMQGEFVQTWLDPYDSSQDSGHLYGYYGALSYILTGEHREYDKNDGRFQGVIPEKNFSIKDFSIKDGNWGAWEIAARWSYLTLDDDDMGIDGGKAFATTVGVNWYLNEYMRLMFNWVRSEKKDVDGAINGIQVRAQIEF